MPDNNERPPSRHRRRLAIVLGTLAAATAIIPPSGAEARSRFDRVPIRVIDDRGRGIEPATVMACPIEDDVANCDRRVTAETNRGGYALLQLRSGTVYSINAFVQDPSPAWPCPGFEIDGHQLYFSEDTITSEPDSLPKHARLTIVSPEASDCVPVAVTDELGRPRANAGVMVCPVVSGVPDCVNSVGATTDQSGVARFDLEPTLTYSVNAFVSDPQPPWACPGYEIDGVQLYFADNVLVGTAAELADAAPLVIREPTPEDCPTTVVANLRVTDVNGTVLPTGFVSVCAYAADGTPCTITTYEGADADGVIRFDVEPSGTYAVGALGENLGWPCPWVAPDGTEFHFSQSRDVTGSDLELGVTLVIREPSPDECPE